tara:strand:+ start:229 stop:645 length:417 start_codon:yes stop_codon:yes gene_type:complete
MAQQMRKFEQDAIVNQIMKTIKSKFEKENEILKTKKEYQAIESINEAIKDIEKRRDILFEEINILQTTRRENLDKFNNKFDVELGTDYTNVFMFKFDKLGIRREVEDKLAIALLDSEWKDNLPDVMEKIAGQFFKERA